MNAVDGPVVLVTEPLHTLKALGQKWDARSVPIHRKAEPFPSLTLKTPILTLKHFSSPLCICGELLDFNGTTDLPLGIIVNKNIVFHCQFEVWDLFTHPPEENIKSPWERHTLGVCGRWVREPSLTEWSRWFHEQHRGVYPENKEEHYVIHFPKQPKSGWLIQPLPGWRRQKIINYVIEKSHLKRINRS